MASVLDNGNHRPSNDLQPPDISATSDEIVNPCCEKCFELTNRRIAPISYCPSCNLFFCKPCDGDHAKLSATHDHEVVNGPLMPKSQAHKPVKYIDCDTHPGYVKFHYCLGHGEMICRLCVEKSHKQCVYKSIPVILQDLSSFDIEILKGDIKSVINQIATCKLSLNINISDVKERRQTMIKEVEHFRDEIISKIDDLFSNVVSEINKETGELISIYQTKVAVLLDATDSLDKAIADIEKAMELQYEEVNEHLFLDVQAVVNRINNLKSDIENNFNEHHVKHPVSFVPKPELVQLICSLSTIGEIRVEKTNDKLLELSPIIFPIRQLKLTQITPKKKLDFVFKALRN